ncbi:unnamed protein product [Heligmosomoides polygyrus]|uniref:Uncharacterized protein n=1 Tax=Heligmosomoides polygyrus TaxID=6339 RepID=A0A183GTS2_HELPZ|nr:unnamed protein product [Heligmosomoides polygyrus]
MYCRTLYFVGAVPQARPVSYLLKKQRFIKVPGKENQDEESWICGAVVLSFSGVGTGPLPTIAQLTGAIASASRNDRSHSVKLTLAALTLDVNAEAKCAISAPPPLCRDTYSASLPYSSSLELRQAAGVCPAL